MIQSVLGELAPEEEAAEQRDHVEEEGSSSTLEKEDIEDEITVVRNQVIVIPPRQVEITSIEPENQDPI